MASRHDHSRSGSECINANHYECQQNECQQHNGVDVDPRPPSVRGRSRRAARSLCCCYCKEVATCRDARENAPSERKRKGAAKISKPAGKTRVGSSRDRGAGLWSDASNLQRHTGLMNRRGVHLIAFGPSSTTWSVDDTALASIFPEKRSPVDYQINRLRFR